VTPEAGSRRKNERAPLRYDARQQRRYGRVGALLFGAASLSAVPSGLLLEPVPGFELIVALALGLASAAACWFIPWERLSTWSLDVVCVAGTLEVLLVCHLIDETYRVLYTLPVVFAALALPTRRRVVVQVAFVLLALTEPILHATGVQDSARIALLFAPVLVIVACAVRYLRETLEARERSSRAFAREAIQLAIRLRRGTPGGEHQRTAELADLERAIDRLS
jgi:hypothetical protein